MVYAETIINKAKEKIGSSDGDFFNTYYYGKKQKTIKAWCCMFVWWVFNECGAGNMLKKTAGCSTLRDWCKKTYKCDTDLNAAKKGDLIFYQFDKDAYADHIGIYHERVSDTMFYAIEGNTDIGSSSYGVGMKSREAKQVQLIAHLGLPSAQSEPSDYTTYKVVKGDSLWKIAAKFYGYGVKWRIIYNYNKLTSTTIRVGQVLKIPTEV